MVRQHHQLHRHEPEQTPGDSGGQEGLVCCCPWSHKESNLTQRLNNSKRAVGSVCIQGKFAAVASDVCDPCDGFWLLALRSMAPATFSTFFFYQFFLGGTSGSFLELHKS